MDLRMESSSSIFSDPFRPSLVEYWYTCGCLEYLVVLRQTLSFFFWAVFGITFVVLFPFRLEEYRNENFPKIFNSSKSLDALISIAVVFRIDFALDPFVENCINFIIRYYVLFSLLLGNDYPFSFSMRWWIGIASFSILQIGAHVRINIDDNNSSSIQRFFFFPFATHRGVPTNAKCLYEWESYPSMYDILKFKWDSNLFLWFHYNNNKS